MEILLAARFSAAVPIAAVSVVNPALPDRRVSLAVSPVLWIFK